MPGNNFFASDGSHVRSTMDSIYRNCQDPVTKAVIGNIFGVIPITKQKITLSCDICEVKMSSQISLENHLKGSKHTKRIHAEKIRAHHNLSNEGNIIKLGGTQRFKCVVCETTLNSSKQLITHLLGSRHRQRENISDRLQRDNLNLDFAIERNFNQEDFSYPDVNLIQMKNKNMFSCRKCCITLNSYIQLQQHLRSRKHFVTSGKLKS